MTDGKWSRPHNSDNAYQKILASLGVVAVVYPDLCFVVRVRRAEATRGATYAFSKCRSPAEAEEALNAMEGYIQRIGEEGDLVKWTLVFPELLGESC